MRGILALIESTAYVLSLVCIYYFHGYQSNEYYGYGQIKTDFQYLLILLTAILFASFVIGRKYRRPSDYFLLLYGLVVIVPYATLSDIFGKSGHIIFINLILIVIPFFYVLFFCSLNFKLPDVSLISENMLTRMILFASVLTIVMLFLNRPPEASFSLAESYVRRLEARDLYGSGTFQSYLSSMMMNGALPLFVFIGILKHKINYLLFGLFLYSGFFYIYGVKAPIVYMIFSGMLAYYSRSENGERKFYAKTSLILLVCFFLAWIEFFLFGYSYIEDYFVRRLFYVGSYLDGAYFGLINTGDFSWISGLLVPTSKSISMYMGEDFLGLPGANANTNTFLYFLAQYGFFGYLFVLLFVGIVLSFLNSLASKNKVFILISVMYSILLLEQSATTALVSSGIGLLSGLYFLTKKPQRS